MYFYPRSPCGERQDAGKALQLPDDISIHALLAESDGSVKGISSKTADFYPRSPCGERLVKFSVSGSVISISIHALLAESDTRGASRADQDVYFYPRSPCGERRQNYECFEWIKEFLSTLSLRRATINNVINGINKIFLSTLSLRRATSSRC